MFFYESDITLTKKYFDNEMKDFELKNVIKMLNELSSCPNESFRFLFRKNQLYNWFVFLKRA